MWAVTAIFCVVFGSGCGGVDASTQNLSTHVPTWDVKHDVMCAVPQGKVDDLHCEVGDVSRISSAETLSFRQESVTLLAPLHGPSPAKDNLSITLSNH